MILFESLDFNVSLQMKVDKVVLLGHNYYKKSITQTSLVLQLKDQR